MKVKTLIALLGSFNPEAAVILQKDSEGNGYSPLEGADHEAIYAPDNTWSGTVYNTKWCAEDAGMSEAEWKRVLKKKRCVVLYPVN